MNILFLSISSLPHISEHSISLDLMLADGPMEATKVENSLLEKGISSRTVKMAKKLIAVESKRKNKVWYWCLPTKDGKYPEITEAEEEDDE